MGVVRFLAPDTDAFVASVERHAPRVRGEHGASARTPDPLGSDEYFSNRIGHRLARG